METELGREVAIPLALKMKEGVTNQGMQQTLEAGKKRILSWSLQEEPPLLTF